MVDAVSEGSADRDGTVEPDVEGAAGAAAQLANIKANRITTKE